MEQEPSRRSTGVSATDPWVGRLVVVVLVALVLVLTAVAYVVYTSVVVGRAPRTITEKQIATLDAAFKATPNDPQVVADYMRELIIAERYSKARSVMNTYRAGETADAAIVSIEEARLLQATGDSEEALDVADRAFDEAKAEKQAKIDAQAKKGISAPFSSTAIVEATLMKAEILQSLDRIEDAVEAIEVALEELPTMADVLVWRGDLEASLGRTDDARADYEKALTMIPDYQPALDGLSALEKGGADE
ncbi:MAG: tetratricopeptide repeat protein [Coriobacteriia bacterium]|nr:tetratricopeptide repeat protein [Coriobacteriia bacterium]